ncbi:MAG: hypothetical protein RLZZ292_3036, partial [Bacteroidota bacterium]
MQRIHQTNLQRRSPAAINPHTIEGESVQGKSIAPPPFHLTTNQSLQKTEEKIAADDSIVEGKIQARSVAPPPF